MKSTAQIASVTEAAINTVFSYMSCGEKYPTMKTLTKFTPVNSAQINLQKFAEMLSFACKQSIFNLGDESNVESAINTIDIAIRETVIRFGILPDTEVFDLHNFQVTSSAKLYDQFSKLCASECRKSLYEFYEGHLPVSRFLTGVQEYSSEAFAETPATIPSLLESVQEYTSEILSNYPITILGLAGLGIIGAFMVGGEFLGGHNETEQASTIL